MESETATRPARPDFDDEKEKAQRLVHDIDIAVKVKSVWEHLGYGAPSAAHQLSLANRYLEMALDALHK